MARAACLSSVPITGKSGLLYNVVHEVDSGTLDCSAVRADVFTPGPQQMTIMSTPAIDGAPHSNGAGGNASAFLASAHARSALAHAPRLARDGNATGRVLTPKLLSAHGEPPLLDAAPLLAGGKVWKEVVEGNPMSFEGVYKANQVLDVGECTALAAAAHKAARAKMA